MSKKVVFKHTKDNASLSALAMAFLMDCKKEGLTNDDVLSVLGMLINLVSTFKEIDEGFECGVVYKATVNVFLQCFENISHEDAERARSYISEKITEYKK